MFMTSGSPKDTNLRHDVAVIIPCYNHAPYLGRALDSVFAQTYRDYRVYVVDDGSTDDTQAVLCSYDGHIISLQQEHSGQAAARNRAIRLSDSQYVAFLDADDEWLPEKLERQVEMLREAPSTGMIYSDCFNDGDSRSSGPYFAQIGTPTGGRVFEQFLRCCGVFTPTVIVRRECLLNVGLFDETLPVGEDFNLWLRIAARWEVQVIPEVLAIRHVTAASLSQSIDREQVALIKRAVCEKLLEACPDLTPHQRRAVQLTIGWGYYGYATYLLAHGESRRSRSQFLESLRYGVRNWRTIAGLGLGFLPRNASLGMLNIYKSIKPSRAPRMPTNDRDQ